MEVRRFGQTGRMVSSLGLGTWQMGGDEWGPRDDQRSLDILRSAIAHGITLIDTADVYGMGHSEELIGEAVPIEVGALVVTKVGWDIYTDPPVVGGARQRYDASYLEHAAAESRRRLRRDRLDVCLLHNPTRPDLEDGSALRAMRELQARGWMSWIGASVGSEDDARAALEAGVDVLQVPFNVVRKWALVILPIAQTGGVAVIAREPFERGLLTGRYGPDATFPAGDHRAGKGRDWLLAAQPGASRVTELAARRDVPPTAIALAYGLSRPEVAATVAGATSVDQLLSNIEGARLRLTPAEMRALEGP
jgi:aryl-alcohol dehydrogenase-like predicted oxidoreductase